MFEIREAFEPALEHCLKMKLMHITEHGKVWSSFHDDGIHAFKAADQLGQLQKRNRRLNAMIKLLSSTAEWKPIEEAPDDGKVFITWCKQAEPMVAKKENGNLFFRVAYFEERNGYFDGTIDWLREPEINPTHYFLIPNAPKEENNE